VGDGPRLGQNHLQTGQRAALVAPHQAGVADNVGGQDRRQFALLTGQWNFPAFLRRIVEGLRLPGNGVKEGGIRGRKEMKGNAIIIAKQAQPVSIS